MSFSSEEPDEVVCIYGFGNLEFLLRHAHGQTVRPAQIKEATEFEEELLTTRARCRRSKAKAVK